MIFNVLLMGFTIIFSRMQNKIVERKGRL